MEQTTSIDLGVFFHIYTYIFFTNLHICLTRNIMLFCYLRRLFSWVMNVQMLALLNSKYFEVTNKFLELFIQKSTRKKKIKDRFNTNQTEAFCKLSFSF